MDIVERLSVCRPPNWEDEGREYVVLCDEAAATITALRARVEELEGAASTHQRALEALEQVLDDSRRGLSMAPATRALALYAYAQAGGSDPDILAGLDAATAMLTELGHFGSQAAIPLTKEPPHAG